MFSYRHPHPAVTTVVVIFTIVGDRLKVLLVRRPRAPFAGEWALPGGFVDLDEALDASANRALERETGVRGVYLEQLFTFGRPDRDPRERVIAVAYYALVPAERVRLRSDATGVDWFPVDNRPAVVFDHEEILASALRRLAAKLEYSTIAFQFMPEEFTLSELQRVYEIIQREPMDKRNFRRRILASDHIEASGERRSGSHRPATLYRVKHPGHVALTR